MAHVRLKDRRPFLRDPAFVRCCASLALCLGILWCETKAWAKSAYEIIDTGIKGGGCWVDDSHFVVVKGHQPSGSQEFDVEGLYYFDSSKPQDLKQIDLSPIDPSLQRHIRDVSCQDQTVLFYVMNQDRQASRLYGFKLGERSEVIAEMQWATPRMVSIKGKFLFNFSSELKKRKMLRSESEAEAKKDCNLSGIKVGFKLVRWANASVSQFWVLPRSVFTKYLWQETVKVQTSDGHDRWVPNPEPPLMRRDGTEVKLGFFLRDLENQIVQEIPMREGVYQYDTINFKPDPKGQYLYCPCWKAGDHGDQQYTVGGRICRFLLDGKNQHWEEVVSVQENSKDLFSLHDLDVNAQGDVVMIERGHRGFISLWKYTAQSRAVDKLLQVRSPEDLSAPQLSPNGRWVSVIRQGQLVLVGQKGAKP